MYYWKEEITVPAIPINDAGKSIFLPVIAVGEFKLYHLQMQESHNIEAIQCKKESDISSIENPINDSD